MAEPTGPEDRSLRDLAAGLGVSVVEFLEERLRLAEDEYRAELRRVQGLALGVAVGVASLMAGVQLFAAGIVLLLAQAIGPPWLVLVLGGLACVALGGLFVWSRARRLKQAPRIFPRTLAELGKDRRWLGGKA